MALGMAAFKSGFDDGRMVQPGLCASGRQQVSRSVCRLVGLGVVMNQNADWEMTFSLYFGRMPNTLARAASRVRLYCAGDPRCAPLRPRHAGRCSPPSGGWRFSNYLAQSIICTSIFYGHGLGLFHADRSSWADPHRARDLGRDAPLWSRAWLARFRFGPAEWLWRSLVYRKVQPMLRHA